VTVVLSWLIGTTFGRTVAAVLLALALAGLSLAWAFRKGKSAADLEAATRSLETLRERIATDEEVRTLSPAGRRERLRQWVRDDPPG